jgi:hypothetical protein
MAAIAGELHRWKSKPICASKTRLDLAESSGILDSRFFNERKGC